MEHYSIVFIVVCLSLIILIVGRCVSTLIFWCASNTFILNLPFTGRNYSFTGVMMSLLMITITVDTEIVCLVMMMTVDLMFSIILVSF